eukprot:SAG22_NODE_5798_length_950_cov_1.779083_1_plen_50_part_00
MPKPTRLVSTAVFHADLKIKSAIKKEESKERRMAKAEEVKKKAEKKDRR